MQENVKYRLIGLTVIMLSASVIFPLLFDGSGYKERHLVSAIPPGPAQPEIVRIEPKSQPLPDTSKPAEPEQPVELKPVAKKVEQAVAKVVKQEKLDLEVEKDQPVLDQQGVPVAWTLQLASFKDATNAKALRKKLVAEDYKVFTRKQGELVKVYVGPELQKSRLEKLQGQLQKEFGLKGIIVRFTTQ